MKNTAASIKDRLKNHARESGLELNPIFLFSHISRKPSLQKKFTPLLFLVQATVV